ncbi:hypothetical protein B5F74_02360 [Collinsella sp. An271]|uniref:helix-turn-helix domain-containing protein n=1 Tax=Collinsella sp. An271 TaxID=1965616 RepID=UPI000B38DDAA|nr:helix-turn-helix domain-containing protein [Collinsella sp. An271]OUO62075.1 hypothetical protein B5F74_02360 [Collinsella sp. An271]
METSLERLRVRAGYRSGAALAAALGVSAVTYNRYERDPAGIPTKSACALADLLGCSVDEVLGRRAPAASQGPVQAAYDALSPESRSLVDSFLETLAAADAQRKTGANLTLRAHALGLYEAYIEDYENSRGLFDGPGGREGFRAYAEGRLAERRERETEASYRGALARLDAAVSTGDVEKEDIAEEIERLRAESVADLEREDGEVLERLMSIYDGEHAAG